MAYFEDVGNRLRRRRGGGYFGDNIGERNVFLHRGVPLVPVCFIATYIAAPRPFLFPEQFHGLPPYTAERLWAAYSTILWCDR